MSVEIALLGFLHEQPMTGYDLKSRFDSTVASFWSAPQSQIYNVLHRLLDEGCVDVQVVPQDGRPNRKIYSITAVGTDRLIAWVSGEHTPPSRRSRSPFLLQLWHGGLVDDETVIQNLRSWAKGYRATLDRLNERVSYWNRQPEHGNRADYYRLLTLDYGVQNMRFQLGWIEDLIKRITCKEYRKGENEAIRHALAEKEQAQ